MTIEFFPDSPTIGMSPRISFSHDLSQTDVVPVEQYIHTTSSTSPSTMDFDFCVFRETFDQESSSADELFFDGKILPIAIKKRLSPSPSPSPSPPPPKKEAPPLPPRPQIQENKRIPTIIEPEEEKQSISNTKSSSFWGFKRSSSLNCGSGYGRTLCPLPLLSRSNSTGSANSSSKRSSSAPNNQKHNNLLKNSASKQNCYSSKPPLKKSTSHGFNGNGVKFNPVLNVPTVNLFGLGSIFSSSKDHKNKKK